MPSLVLTMPIMVKSVHVDGDASTLVDEKPASATSQSFQTSVDC